uniref:Uncharacterized protein n=1 Tax=Lepeophtheirus salmonis TaxID=72036 RepID=A0A0K2UDB1_LEPSM
MACNHRNYILALVVSCMGCKQQSSSLIFVVSLSQYLAMTANRGRSFLFTLSSKARLKTLASVSPLRFLGSNITYHVIKEC